jgi:hypothetical protein
MILINYGSQGNPGKIIVDYVCQIFPDVVAQTGAYVIAFCAVPLAGGDIEILAGGVKNFLDSELIQGFGEAKAPAGSPYGVYDARFSEFEKDLLQEYRGNVFLFRQNIDGNRIPALPQLCQSQRCPQRVTSPCSNPHGIISLVSILTIIINYSSRKIKPFFRFFCENVEFFPFNEMKRGVDTAAGPRPGKNLMHVP